MPTHSVVFVIIFLLAGSVLAESGIVIEENIGKVKNKLKVENIGKVENKLKVESLGRVKNLGTAKNEEARESKTKLSKAQREHAKQWQLTADEYRQYLSIMKSSRPYFTPNLDKNPLLALALEAETALERMALANRWVQIEYENNIKVIAWQLEVNDAWKRQFPGVPRFAYKRPALSQHSVSNLLSSPRNSVNALDKYLVPKPRAQLFLAIGNCDKCVEEYKRQYKAMKAGKIEGVDIHFVGSPSKEAIVSWAVKQEIDQSEVNSSRVITLNVAERNVMEVPFVEYIK